jgi:beta-N-acetylhexosaminidase
VPGSATIFGVAGTALTPDERAFLRAADPWGFILFARNVHSPGQLRVLTSDLRETVGRHAPVLIDQEGGRVQRMRSPLWREYLPALDQMARASDPIRAQWVRNRLIAQELFTSGIDVNCAPLADLVEPESHPVLRNRLYGSEVETVVAAAKACADALLAGGVMPVLKHIPGYGRATVDGHLALPRVSVSLADLVARDFAPFHALRRIRMGMTAHIVMEAIDPDRAATVSPAVMAVIRGQIGFDGLIMTDDISMEALSGTIAERASASIAAGCDIVLHCNGKLAEMEAVAVAAGPMSAAAVARGAAALAERQTPMPVDIPALVAELDSLLAVA